MIQKKARTTMRSLIRGLDYQANTNRWLSPDSIVPDPTNPQSFNRYSYVLNNPLNFSDPSGHMQQRAIADIDGFTWAAGATLTGLVIQQLYANGVDIDWGRIASWERGNYADMWALHDSLQQTNAGHIDGSSTNNADDLQNLAGNVSGSPGDFDPNDDDDLELQFQETSSGTNRIRSTEIDGTRFRFNTGHGFDRVHTNQATGVTTDLRTTNLTPNQIESAIAQDAFNYSSNGGNIPRVGTGFQGPLVRSITINDFNIEYRVVQLADESINISTYYLLP